MSPLDKPALLALLAALRTNLQQERSSEVVTQALHQCERLNQAITQFHAEGLRFAAFTLVRLTAQHAATLSAATLAAAKALKEGLDASGYLSQH
jgi:hypothetical protein